MLAVIAGMLIYAVVSELLETTLVSATADRPITDIAAYFSMRNTPMMLGAKVVYNSMAAILAGYMTAKIAGQNELRYAGMVAALETASLIWGYTMGEYASFTPVWMRGVIVLTTGPAMMVGASIRHRAATRLEAA